MSLLVRETKEGPGVGIQKPCSELTIMLMPATPNKDRECVVQKPESKGVDCRVAEGISECGCSGTISFHSLQDTP